MKAVGIIIVGSCFSKAYPQGSYKILGTQEEYRLISSEQFSLWVSNKMCGTDDKICWMKIGRR